MGTYLVKFSGIRHNMQNIQDVFKNMFLFIYLFLYFIFFLGGGGRGGFNNIFTQYNYMYLCIPILIQEPTFLPQLLLFDFRISLSFFC